MVLGRCTDHSTCSITRHLLITCYYNLSNEVKLQHDTSKLGLGAEWAFHSQQLQSSHTSRDVICTGRERTVSYCFHMWKIWYIHLQQGHGCSRNRSQALESPCPQSTQLSTTTPSGKAPSTSKKQLRDYICLYIQERQGDVSYWHPQQSLPTLSACVCAEIEEIDHKASLPVSETWWQIEYASVDDPVFQELWSIIQCG